MKESAADVLGSTFYLARIRSLAIKAYSVQIAIMFGLGFFLSLMQGATFKPFYFPLEYFMYVVYIMLFAMMMEAFFFVMLEMRNQDTDSAKYFTARKTAKKAIKIMVVSIILLALFANPVSERFLEEKSVDTYTLNLHNGEATINISSLDRFGLMYRYAVIEGKNYSGNYDAYLIYASYYYDNMSDPGSRSRLKFLNTDSGTPLTIHPPDIDYQEYVILIKGNGTGSFTVKIYSDVKDMFVIYTGIFLIATAISQAWWYVNMQRYIKIYGTELVTV